MSDEPETKEIVYCTHEQCADMVVPCPRCTVLVIEPDGTETTTTWGDRPVDSIA